MPVHFRVVEHTVPTAHIREYPGGTAHSQEEVLNLHVKQYIPLDQQQPPSRDACTFVAVHGAALPKELYEPLWDELYLRSKRHNFEIRSIWFADVVNQNQSGVLNEHKLGMDFSHLDHARDLFLMINQFRDQMPRPLVGIGHSLGGCMLTHLAFMHPRLFTTLLLLDPIMQISRPPMGFGSDPPGNLNFIVHRKDVWPSREAAVAQNAYFFKDWDPRCSDIYKERAYRDLPTALYSTSHSPDSKDTAVTLATTKHQEVRTLARSNFTSRQPDRSIKIDRSTHADLNPLFSFIPIYRPEPPAAYNRLPELRPPTLFALGGKTFTNLDELREGIRVCGTGIGGSGGKAEGKVKEVLLPELGHLFVFQDPARAAAECALWLEEQMVDFREAERKWRLEAERKSARDHLVLSQEWFEVVKPIKPLNRAKGSKL